MVVRLRLARFGRKNLPFYRIFVAENKARRDGRHIEIIGYYNPLPGTDGMKRIGIKSDRAKYWLSVGAQPSRPVAMLLWKVGLLPKPPVAEMMTKADAAKVLAKIKEKEKAEAAVKGAKKDSKEPKSGGRASSVQMQNKKQQRETKQQTSAAVFSGCSSNGSSSWV